MPKLHSCSHLLLMVPGEERKEEKKKNWINWKAQYTLEWQGHSIHVFAVSWVMSTSFVLDTHYYISKINKPMVLINNCPLWECLVLNPTKWESLAFKQPLIQAILQLLLFLFPNSSFQNLKAPCFLFFSSPVWIVPLLNSQKKKKCHGEWQWHMQTLNQAEAKQIWVAKQVPSLWFSPFY